MENSRLFKPLQIGSVTLQNRIAMAPLTRFRATLEHVPTPIMAEYYGQRASTPGTLIVSEATFIAPEHGGYARAPGIWSDDQVAGWRAVTDAVHAQGSFIYCQLWALGRAASTSELALTGHVVRSASAIKLKFSGQEVRSASAAKIRESGDEEATPVPLTEAEIQDTIQKYATAAKNAIAAGFDGVEIHGANGYLIDQFLQDVSNERTDEWGGSIENRSRFAIKVAEAVVAAVGADRVGIRLSPYGTFQDMRMADPVPQFTDVLTKLDKLNLAYVHVVSGRIAGDATHDDNNKDSLDFVFAAWPTRPILVAGGLTSARAAQLVDEERPDRDVVAVFGRHFISTPDLVFRVRHGLPFNPYDRTTFYNWKSIEGYTGQPFSEEFLAQRPEFK